MNQEEKRKYVFAQLNSLRNPFQYVEVANFIKSIEQENQQLKEIEKEHQKINGELMTRINKAIEFVDNWQDIWYSNSMLDDKEYLDELLEILKGGKE